jgi:hypothetical protein
MHPEVGSYCCIIHPVWLRETPARVRSDAPTTNKKMKMAVALSIFLLFTACVKV